MKTIPGALQTHLNGEITTLATCWKVTLRDGTIFGLTDHDADLTLNADGLGSVTYVAATGYRRTAIQTQLGLQAGNLELEGLFDTDGITEDDLRSGRFDFAGIKIFTLNWANTSQGIIKERRGVLGSVTRKEGMYTAEMRGLASYYQRNLLELYTADCRADLGDTRCTVQVSPVQWDDGIAKVVGDRVIATSGHLRRQFRASVAGTTGGVEPSWSDTIDATVTDGSVTWVTEYRYVIPATVATVTRQDLFTIVESVTEFPVLPSDGPDWFHAGIVTWVTGDNADVKQEIKSVNQTTGAVSLYLGAGAPIVPGDTLLLQVGCDRLMQTCKQRFHNLINFRGFPYVPGKDRLLSYATHA